MNMKFAVIVFPGSNCDHDAYYALKKKLLIDVEFIWHKETSLKGFSGILIPGGFSYGDYLRTGSIARFSPIMKSLVREANKGVPVIGICNGFQILLESGLLPGALINNKKIKFLSKQVTLDVITNQSIFSNKLNNGDKLKMPIAHREGNYIASQDVINRLEDQNRIIFKYSNKNPNGSMHGICGIVNKNRNVLGMMPHPERACEKLLGSNDGKKIFESILEGYN